MDVIQKYPKECRKQLRRLMNATGMSIDTAYAMMLMTAALMDLKPDDPYVVDMVLEDCGIFPEVIA
jgi:hypothetical protein